MLGGQVDPGQAAHDDEEAAVGGLVGGDDPAQAGARIDRRAPVIVALVAGAEAGDGQEARPGEGVADQLAVARLEDVERHEPTGQEHRVGQREDR
jgi:hypothetical protein